MTQKIVTPICGCLGCHEPATVIIDHPDHGDRAVCVQHAKNYQKIRII